MGFRKLQASNPAKFRRAFQTPRLCKSPSLTAIAAMPAPAPVSGLSYGGG
jgi:hypothetical protein